MFDQPGARGGSGGAHPDSGSVSTALAAAVRKAIAAAGGWVPFDRFMHWALYWPELGYYARAERPFGALPASGSDFVTAPELSPLFGRALAAQVRQGLQLTGAAEVWEFGAGSGALAESLLEALGDAVERYSIIDVSTALRGVQQRRLQRFGDRVQWCSALPPALNGVVLGNEVLDAMPARLVAFDGRRWNERGVACRAEVFVFEDRPGAEPPPNAEAFAAGAVTELHPQAQAFVATLARMLERGLALLLDYGFPEAEYYHPQRHGGTLMCHRGHRSDVDPLADIGLKDITVHLDFSALALAAQDAGADVLGYTSQGRFLLNCGIGALLETAPLAARANAQKLLTEHEMGELFKVLAFGRGIDAELIGFATGDRLHRL